MDFEALLTLPGLPVDRLDADEIAAALAPGTARLVERLDVFAEIDSTNRYLLEHPPTPGRLAVCLAEYQHAGRGRRGRAWVAPAGAALCLSVGWKFAERPLDLTALTLACGVAARRALEASACVSVRLKWPNDLVWDDRKLGGILVELGAEPRGLCHAVVGIGINVSLPADWLRRVSDWPRGAVDLREATRAEPSRSRGANSRPGRADHEAAGLDPPGRSRLAAALVDGFADVLSTYASAGFAPYLPEFRSADWLADRTIRIDDARGALEGVARGIDPDGALRVELGGGRVRRVESGDVSVRWGG
jgi:BirA family biotin operon repressor/biotin-[acetyl-CoA-carboxylase] ligase